MVVRLFAFLFVLCAGIGCSSDSPADRDRSPRALDGGEALDARADARHDQAARDSATFAVDAGVVADLPDPTLPGAFTGVHRVLGDDYQAELAALLAYERDPSVNALACPGIGQASTCGDGKCDGSAGETAGGCPADCIFHEVGAYNDLPICPSYQQVVTPHSIAEVQSAVRAAVLAGQRVRPIGKRHSASAAICGDGIALDLSALGDVTKTRIEGEVAYVEPGVLMIDLGDWLAARGLGIGFTHLGFRGVSVAGAIGTSAHGSSPSFNNSLAMRVVSLQVVLADATLRTFTAADPAFRALQTSLGLLGVVVEVGLRVEPAFQLEVDVSVREEAELLSATSPLDLLTGCDWGQFNWFPNHRKFLRWCGVKTQQPAQPGANNTLLDPGVGSGLAPIAKAGFHAGTCDDGFNAQLEQARLQGLIDEPPLVIDGDAGAAVHVSHAVGPAHRMTSADLIALHGNKYFQMDWEVAIPQQYMSDAIAAARQMFDAHDVSLPGVGVFVRFGKIEKGGWLSYHSAGGDFAEGQTAMFFESPVAVPAGYSATQLADYLHIYQELISLFVRHFGARGHWGKNLDPVFDLQRTVGTYAGRIDRMNQAVADLDPYGVFANDFARRIGIVWPRDEEDFATGLAQSTCTCDVTAKPVCAFREKLVYANSCRATCAGKTSIDLVDGPCDALTSAPCPLPDTKTCVWNAKAREQNPLSEPVLRY